MPESLILDGAGSGKVIIPDIAFFQSVGDAVVTFEFSTLRLNHTVTQRFFEFEGLGRVHLTANSDEARSLSNIDTAAASTSAIVLQSNLTYVAEFQRDITNSRITLSIWRKDTGARVGAASSTVAAAHNGLVNLVGKTLRFGASVADGNEISMLLAWAQVHNDRVSIAIGATIPVYRTSVPTGKTIALSYPLETNANDAQGNANMQLLGTAALSNTSPPNKVQNLNLVGGNTVVDADWDNTDNAATYELERSSTSGTADFATVRDFVANPLTVSILQDTGRTNGTPLWYRARAKNQYGYGEYSDVKTVTPSAPVVTAGDKAIKFTGNGGHCEATLLSTHAAFDFHVLEHRWANVRQNHTEDQCFWEVEDLGKLLLKANSTNLVFVTANNEQITIGTLSSVLATNILNRVGYNKTFKQLYSECWNLYGDPATRRWGRLSDITRTFNVASNRVSIGSALDGSLSISGECCFFKLQKSDKERGAYAPPLTGSNSGTLLFNYGFTDSLADSSPSVQHLTWVGPGAPTYVTVADPVPVAKITVDGVNALKAPKGGFFAECLESRAPRNSVSGIDGLAVAWSMPIKPSGATIAFSDADYYGTHITGADVVGNYKLRVDLTDTNGVSAFEEYPFTVSEILPKIALRKYDYSEILPVSGEIALKTHESFRFDGTASEGHYYYQWDLGDGSNFVYNRGGGHFYDHPGLYALRLRAFNKVTNVQAAPTATVWVRVTDIAPAASNKILTMNATPTAAEFQEKINLAATMNDTGNVEIHVPNNLDLSGKWQMKPTAGNYYITIRPVDLSNLPENGIRIDFDIHGVNMPRLQSTGGSSEPCVEFNFGAHHWRFVGIDFYTAIYRNKLVQVGDEVTTHANLPHHIIFQHCAMHGNAVTGGGCLRALDLSCGEVSVVDCSIFECHHTNQDSQAIAGRSGVGPWCFHNSDVIGAGENFLFGGGDSGLVTDFPSDIEFLRCWFLQPLHWRTDTIRRMHKNNGEFKVGRRCVVDSCIFENSHADGQIGYLLSIKFTNAYNYHMTTRDIQISNCEFLNGGVGVTLQQRDSDHWSPRAYNWRLWNNRWLGIDSAIGSGDWVTFSGSGLQGAGVGISLRNNTAFQNKLTIQATGIRSLNFELLNGINTRGSYGVKGDVEGNPTLYGQMRTSRVDGNVLSNVPSTYKNKTVNTAAGYRGDDFQFPNTWNDIGFVDPVNNTNLRLLDTSVYKNDGTDGADPGANHDVIDESIHGVRTGRFHPSAPELLPAVSATTATTADLTLTSRSKNGTGFKIERRAGTTGAWSNVAFTALGNNLFRVSGLSGGTEYQFRAREYNAVGDSPYSGIAVANTSGSASTLR